MTERWIIPCNLKHFDVIEHFGHTNIAVWKNSFTIKVGDTVYIYLSAPISAIMYRCHVISDKVTDEDLKEHQYAVPQKESHNYFSKKVKYIKIQVDRKYPNKALPLEILRQHGLGQVQIQARADRALSQFLRTMDEQFDARNGSDGND